MDRSPSTGASPPGLFLQDLQLAGRPFVSVAPRGGSPRPNQGADFGPDTPGTSTGGIQEALNASSLTGYQVVLLPGNFVLPQGSSITVAPGQVLRGSGGSTTLTLVGGGDGVLVPGNIAPQMTFGHEKLRTLVADMHIVGSPRTNACVRVRDNVGTLLSNLTIRGASSGCGVAFETQTAYVETNTLFHVLIGGCLTGIHFHRNGGDPSAAHNYLYATGITLNKAITNATGILIDDGLSPYGNFWQVQVWMNPTPTNQHVAVRNNGGSVGYSAWFLKIENQAQGGQGTGVVFSSARAIAPKMMAMGLENSGAPLGANFVFENGADPSQSYVDLTPFGDATGSQQPGINVNVGGSLHAVGHLVQAFKPANPKPTGTPTPVLMGLGSTVQVTPRSSGALKVMVCGVTGAPGSAPRQTVQLVFGAGPSPANGAAAPGPGTFLGNGAHGLSTGFQSPNASQAFTLVDIVTGLKVGSPYWFDLAVAPAEGPGWAGVSNLSWVIDEL